MENLNLLTILTFALILTLMVIVVVCFRKLSSLINKHISHSNSVHPVKETKAEEDVPKIINEELRKISEECEAKLPINERGIVKLLVYRDNKALLAGLRIGNLSLSLEHKGNNVSFLDTDGALNALKEAKQGSFGTGKYIPVPSELKDILKFKKLINVYLEALGLEQISEDGHFLCVDVQTGWNTGWKRFNWDPLLAYEKLEKRFKVKTPKEFVITASSKAKLFLLIKGWDHMFLEV